MLRAHSEALRRPGLTMHTRPGTPQFKPAQRPCASRRVRTGGNSQRPTSYLIADRPLDRATDSHDLRPVRLAATCAALAFATFLLAPCSATAAEAVLVAPASAAAAAPWAATGALTILILLPGLAMFQAGLLRTGSVATLLYHHVLAAAIVSILWFTFAFSTAASPTGMAAGHLNLRSVFGAPDAAMLRGVVDGSVAQNLPQLGRALFSLVPAIAAPCIAVSGAAERMRPTAMALFSALWLPAVYVPVAHAVGGGPGALLGDLGVLDATGSLALCVASGFSSLMLALLVGARRTRHRACNNLPLTLTGAALLWAGWLSLAAGCAPNDATAAMSVLCTHLGAAASIAVWALLDLFTGKPSAVGVCYAVVAGLVAVSPAAATVSPAAAMLIGATAGLCARLSVWLLRQGADDALASFSLFGVAGVVGSAMTAFGSAQLLGGAQSSAVLRTQVVVQLFSCAAVATWSLFATLVVAKVTAALTGGLRVPAEVEDFGTDLLLQEETAYSNA